MVSRSLLCAVYYTCCLQSYFSPQWCVVRFSALFIYVLFTKLLLPTMVCRSLLCAVYIRVVYKATSPDNGVSFASLRCVLYVLFTKLLLPTMVCRSLLCAVYYTCCLQSYFSPQWCVVRFSALFTTRVVYKLLLPTMACRWLLCAVYYTCCLQSYFSPQWRVVGFSALLTTRVVYKATSPHNGVSFASLPCLLHVLFTKLLLPTMVCRSLLCAVYYTCCLQSYFSGQWCVVGFSALFTIGVVYKATSPHNGVSFASLRCLLYVLFTKLLLRTMVCRWLLCAVHYRCCLQSYFSGQWCVVRFSALFTIRVVYKATSPHNGVSSTAQW